MTVSRPGRCRDLAETRQELPVPLLALSDEVWRFRGEGVGPRRRCCPCGPRFQGFAVMGLDRDVAGCQRERRQANGVRYARRSRADGDLSAVSPFGSRQPSLLRCLLGQTQRRSSRGWISLDQRPSKAGPNELDLRKIDL